MAEKRRIQQYWSISYYSLRLTLEESCEIKQQLAYKRRLNPSISNDELRGYLLISGISNPALKEKIKNADSIELYDAFDSMVDDIDMDRKALKKISASCSSYEDAKKTLLKSQISKDLVELLRRNNPVLQKQIETAIEMYANNPQQMFFGKNEVDMEDEGMDF